MPDLTLKLVIQALDKGASSTVGKLDKSVKSLSTTVKVAPLGWIKTREAMDKTSDAARRFNEAGRQGGRTLDDLIQKQRRLREETERTNRVWARYTRLLDYRGRTNGGVRGRFGMSIIRGVEGLASMGGVGLAGLAGTGVGLVAAGVGAAAGASVTGGLTVAKKSIDAGASLETYRLRLKRIEGDADKAAKAATWIRKFDLKAPTFDLDEVAQAWINLRSAGVEPTSGAMKKLGNGAVAMKKDLLSAVEALTDGMAGQYDRLQDFGIRAKRQGKQVAFTYDKAGKEITVLSKTTASAIRETLLDIFDARFAGAMDDQARSWTGMTQTLGDRWVDFLERVADSGLFETAKKHLSSFLDWLDKAEKDGRLDKWAKQASESLSRLLDTLARLSKEVDWVELIKNMAALAEASARIVEGTAWFFGKPKPRVRPPGRFDRLFEMVDNPAALSERDAQASAARRTFGAGGGPQIGTVPVAPLKGNIQIGLAPGLRLYGVDLGNDITAQPSSRRGFAGTLP